jgi:uncharacterized protein YndB with AHSA1/START domain
MTATLDIGNGRSTLRFDRLLGHSRDRVWIAVTDPQELVHWFPTAVVYEPRVGAPMQFDFGGREALDVYPGEVLEWDPPSVFAFAWGEDVLRFELVEEDGATRLLFSHSFAHEPGREARDAAGWEACFEAFDALLDGDADPAAGDWARHHDEHVALFGELELEAPDGVARLRLQGPYMKVDGRPAVSVRLGDEPGVLVVRDEGRALEHGAPVEVLAGTIEEPGEAVAGGVLRDPLASR